MNVLVVGAHPDDELLGAGGAVAKHADNGDHVTLAILCEGESVRYGSERRGEVAKQSADACAILRAAEVVIGDLPDQRLDTLPISTIASRVEELIRRHAPSVVYTHFSGDLNRDHRLVCEATMIATRPYSTESVKEVLMFETSSSTEWGEGGVGISFRPTVFVDIAATVERKLQALACYSAEVRETPHPRSLYGVRTRASHWGSIVGSEAAEAFMPIRIIR